MSEAKPIASLSSGLLARKGHASPAMRRQNFSIAHASAELPHDDLGWNDMGHEEQETHAPSAPIAIHDKVEVAVASIAPPPVVVQQERLVEEFAVAPLPFLTPQPPVRAAPGSRAKSAFTLRLDAERHLRLRLVCAVHHRSAQQIVTQALDDFLSRQPDNARLAGKR